MFENLDVFRLSHALARHAGARQAVVAQNMANADTPGYAAREIAPFAAFVDAAPGMRATRPGHLFGQGDTPRFEARTERGATRDPNGNSVSLETEMLRAVDLARDHDRALAIYRSGMTVLRTAISRS
ncbi:MAG: FlgB family protein [Roseovarius sp.]|nr:FlgB family protein [Roseovarius sp.]